MTQRFSEERWRAILELSEQVMVLPVHERSAYLIGTGVDSEVSVEVLELAAQFQDGTPEAAPLDARVGTSIGRFLITGVLGSGGMGDVYSARDTELDRPVALKFLRPEALAYDTAYQKFIREAQTASLLNHPNIVTIYEIVRTGSSIAIVMELADGAPLRTLIGDSQNPMTRILEIGGQIASALAAAHGRGIVHRDIKPENVLVQTDGRVKVLDFGLARQISKATSASSLYPAGTLRYLSPEQARGEAASPASDVFSLGIVLHELSTGRHPFPGDSPFETVYSILQGEPERLESNHRVPRPFVALVEAMLSKDSVQRPLAGDVARRLGEMQRSVDVKPSQLTRPRPRLIAWGAVLALAVVSAAIWMELRSGRDADFRNLRIQPLTSQPGWEAAPAFSADGKFIAYTWNSHSEKPQIYVRHLDGADAIKITDIESAEVGPLVWSPDGKEIAFKTQVPGLGGAICRIAAGGGPVSTVLQLTNANPTSSIDWSPDGEKLVFSDEPPGTSQLALYTFDLRTGEKLKLTSPPKGIWGDWSPTFSPDGQTIALKRVTGYWLDEIYLVPSSGGAARQLTSIKAGIWGHAWTATGDSLIVSCQRGSTILSLWRFALADPLRPERIQQGAGDLITPASARNSNRIAWVSRTWDTNIYRESVSGAEPPYKLIASTQRDQNPAVAADGRIAFVSDRSGSREIWMAGADGGNETKITDFGGPPVDHLMWSPDGRRLAFDSRLEGRDAVLTIECPPEAQHCSKPQTVIPWGSAPAWSADGRAILYSSIATGSQQVWRHPMGGGSDTMMTRSGGYFSRETRDGRWLYFSKTGSETIYRIPSASFPGRATPGEPVVDASIRALPFGWDVGSAEVFFFEMPANRKRWAVQAVSVASNRLRFVSDWGDSYADADGMGLSVSHDGKWLFYPRLDSAEANIMIAESGR